MSTKNLKVLAIFVGLVVLGVTVVLIINFSGDQGPQAACFRVGYLNITASAPLFVAEDRNFFQENDVCVETQVLATSNQLVDAIAADQLDYVVEASAVPALALQLRSPGRFFVTAVSTISQEQPFDAILVNTSSTTAELQDLSGKKIAVFPGTTATNLLKAFLEEKGVDTSEIEFLPTPPQNLLAGLRSGAVDAAHVYEPAWTIGRNDSTLRQLYGTVYGEQLSPNPQGISILNRRTAESRPNETARLVRAFDQALTYMRQDRDSMNTVLANHFTLPGNTIEDMHILYMTPHEEIDWNSLDRYVDLLIAVGELESRPDLTDLAYE